MQLARDNYVKLALETLELAIAAGYSNAKQMRQDEDLTPLRNLPEFQKLARKAESEVTRRILRCPSPSSSVFTHARGPCRISALFPLRNGYRITILSG